MDTLHTGSGQAGQLAGTAADLVAGVLVAAKLIPPRPPPGAIARPRPRRLLASGAHGKLTLLVAPAGFGKTVLASQWLSPPPGPLAWLSLDRRDNAPARFWAYLLAALARAGMSPQPWADALLGRVATGPPDQALAPLANALGGLPPGMILVLDDYHLITEPAIHRGLAFLAEHQPPGFHLVILTRTDPPFVPARWRAGGQVTQLRTADLAFSTGEMTAFLHSQQLTLPASLAGPLLARLRGWPAALRLVTLWLARRKDQAAALASFAASDTTITDYLTSEVLAQLPAALRSFLLQTSILARLTGPLCDAVTGGHDGAQTLAGLDRSGMFTEALGPGPGWYRYHDLFRELLQLELARTSPGQTAGLHRRASTWLAAAGRTADAIGHSLAAADWPAVQQLILSQALTIGSRYPPSVVESWFTDVPAHVLHASQTLLVLHGFVLIHLGRPADTRAALDRAQALAREHGPEPGLPELGALRCAISASAARLDCDLAAARRSHHDTERELRQATAGPSALAGMARAAVGNALAGALYWHGDLPAARQLLADVEQQTAGHQLARMRANCLALTALLLADDGRLREATTYASQAVDLAREAGVTTLLQTTPALLATATVALQRGDHATAASQAQTAADQAGRHHDRGALLTALTLLARAHAAAGNTTDALGRLDQAQAAYPGWQPPAALRAALGAEQARICLADGDLPAARAACQQLQALPPAIPAVHLAAAMTQARLLHADGHHAQAAVLFTTTAQTALDHRQLPAAVEALAAAAAAHWSQGHTGPATTALGQALTLAQDEDITAPFLDQATATRPLLLAMEHGPQSHPAPGFRRRLLTAMGIPASPPASHATTSPADALTNRELTVLRLLHGHLTNAEIATTLNITPNTLKTHLRNLYRKLGAASRQQAVTRYHQLNPRPATQTPSQQPPSYHPRRGPRSVTGRPDSVWELIL